MTGTLTPPADLADLGEWLDGLIQDLAEHPDAAVRERVAALLDGVDALHRAALGRLVGLLQAPGAEATWARVQRDPIVRATLLLYDLLPQTERERAEEALETIVPYIESHGGTLELRGVADGAVTVRLGGACQGCSGSAMTLRRVVEEALRNRFDGFQRLLVEEPPQAPVLRIPPPTPTGGDPLRGKRALPVLVARPAPRWQDAAALADLPPGALVRKQIEGEPILLCNVGGEIYAYRDACPDTPLALSLGHLDSEAIVCPWHGCRFDARTGQRLIHRGTNLATYPVAVTVSEDIVRVAVNVPGPSPPAGPAIAVSNRS